jgi:hypothetical protein
VKQDKLAELQRLFSKLHDWPMPQASSLVPLVLHNLDILSVITEDHSNVKSIATNLSLILKSRPNAEQKLRDQFLDIENSLENDLRGFSSLLDLVLEENTIRLDTCELLDQLPEKFQILAERFNRLVRQIDALVDLEMAFDIGHPQVLCLLFLLSFEEILGLQLSSSRREARRMMVEWLKGHIPQSILCPLLDSDIDFEDRHSVIKYCQAARPGFEDIAIVFLCRASAEQIVLPADSYAQLDAVIIQIGLDGLMPLVESGFITLEGCPKGDNVAKIFYVV